MEVDKVIVLSGSWLKQALARFSPLRSPLTSITFISVFMSGWESPGRATAVLQIIRPAGTTFTATGPPPTPAPAHSITLQEFSEAQLHYGGKEEQIEVHSCRRTRTHAPHRYKEVEEVRTRQREQPAYKGSHWQAFSLVVNTLHK